MFKLLTKKNNDQNFNHGKCNPDDCAPSCSPCMPDYENPNFLKDESEKVTYLPSPKS